jgi:putative addiction module component (TIGR02574 family)
MRSADEILDEAMQLSVEERSWLGEDLLDSVKTGEERAIEQEWLVEIERRVAEVEAGTAVLIPAEQVIRELKAKSRGRRRSG